MKPQLLLVVLAAATLAGCADDAPAEPDDGTALDVTEATGGIRGVVVDGGIRPVEGATVTLTTGPSTTTDAEGLFVFTGLEPGEYFLRAEKLAHETTQAAATVQAGVKTPPMVKIVLPRIAGADPYMTIFKFDGFYECAFSAEFITDQCDFGVRTVADELNHTVGNPGVPRSLQDNRNTQYIELEGNVRTVIQEAFWESSNVNEMMILLGSTPIDNACDCSDVDYLDVIEGSPTYGRLDDDAVPAGELVAARGFLPWSTSQALNHQFTIITSTFHNYNAPEGWNFMEQDSFPHP